MSIFYISYYYHYEKFDLPGSRFCFPSRKMPPFQTLVFCIPG